MLAVEQGLQCDHELYFDQATIIETLFHYMEENYAEYHDEGFEELRGAILTYLAENVYRQDAVDLVPPATAKSMGINIFIYQRNGSDRQVLHCPSGKSNWKAIYLEYARKPVEHYSVVAKRQEMHTITATNVKDALQIVKGHLASVGEEQDVVPVAADSTLEHSSPESANRQTSRSTKTKFPYIYWHMFHQKKCSKSPKM